MKILVQKEYEDSFDLPVYKTPGASGVDLSAYLHPMDRPNGILLRHGEWVTIKTGFRFAIPEGVEGQIRARSGLARDNGLFVLNSPGTIDSDYRGEVGVILANMGLPIVITHGMRIAQLVFVPVIRANLEFADSLPVTLRGEGGFGSTGC